MKMPTEPPILEYATRNPNGPRTLGSDCRAVVAFVRQKPFWVWLGCYSCALLVRLTLQGAPSHATDWWDEETKHGQGILLPVVLCPALLLVTVVIFVWFIVVGDWKSVRRAVGITIPFSALFGLVQWTSCPHATYLQLAGGFNIPLSGRPCNNGQSSTIWWIRLLKSP
jgi:hypothetical protein